MAEAIRVTHSETADELAVDSHVRSLGARSLESQVRDVVQLRADVAGLQGALDEKKRAYEESIADVKQVHGVAAAALARAETTLRELAIARYREDSSTKQLVPGVSIQLVTVVSYEEKDAISWARENDIGKDLLSLKRGPFETIAKKLDLPFVTKEEEVPTTRIARDLSGVA